MNMFEEEYVTGYQYSPVDGKFMGEYNFPKNKNGETLHLPPHTTLTRIPRRKIKENQFWKWDGSAWISETQKTIAEEIVS